MDCWGGGIQPVADEYCFGAITKFEHIAGGLVRVTPYDGILKLIQGLDKITSCPCLVVFGRFFHNIGLSSNPDVPTGQIRIAPEESEMLKERQEVFTALFYTYDDMADLDVSWLVKRGFVTRTKSHPKGLPNALHLLSRNWISSFGPAVPPVTGKGSLMICTM